MVFARFPARYMGASGPPPEGGRGILGVFLPVSAVESLSKLFIRFDLVRS